MFARAKIFQEVGGPQTLAGKDKVFAVERRGGYPWADGFFNRNDPAPLPLKLSDDSAATLTLHLSDAPRAVPGKASLTLRCILFQAKETDLFAIRFNVSVEKSPLPTRRPRRREI